MTMKKTLLSGVAALALVAAAHSAQAADATGNTSASVIAPITIAQGAALSFGNISPSGTTGTVVISTAGARTATNVDLLTGGTVAAATFNVGGSGASTYTITLPTSLTLNGSVSGTMLVNGFNHDVVGTPALSSGTASFAVGATVAVDAAQAAGTYTGDYTVTVNYN